MTEVNENSHTAVDNSIESLEQRVKRLEDALASLQDTRVLEDRVFQRVSLKMEAPKPPPDPPPKSKEQPVPENLQEKVSANEKPPGPDISENIKEKAGEFISTSTGVSPQVVRHSWFLWDVWSELRTILRMFFDVRYRLAWTTRLAVSILLVLILTSQWWVPFASIPWIGPIWDKVVDLILAFFMFKILVREGQRYREKRM